MPAKSTLEERQENEVIYYDYHQETLPFAFDTSKIVPMSYSYNFQPMIFSGIWISTPIDLIKLIPEKLGRITKYPDIDLFDKH